MASITLLSPVYYVHHQQLFYGHRSINDHFSDGSPLEKLAYDVINDDVDVLNFEPMLIKKVNGKRFVIDGNRRLFVYKQLHECGCDVGFVPVQFTTRPEHRVLVRPDEGVQIGVRGRGNAAVEREIWRLARVDKPTPSDKLSAFFHQLAVRR